MTARPGPSMDRYASLLSASARRMGREEIKMPAAKRKTGTIIRCHKLTDLRLMSNPEKAPHRVCQQTKVADHVIHVLILVNA